MRVISDLKEMRAAVGTELGVSGWTEIDQERINLFAEATGDHQWLHVDVERAAGESPFGGTVAHGFLTLALVPLLVRSAVRLEGVRASLNYGLNRVRFPSPVPAGARLRGRVRLKAAEDADPRGLRVTYETIIEIEGRERPVCTAETIVVHYW
jgi:acyl dehydratase